MKKRGIANIIVMVLTILIVIITIVLFYNIFNVFLKEKSFSIEESSKNFFESLQFGKQPITLEEEQAAVANYIIQFEDEPVVSKRVELKNKGLNDYDIGIETKKYSLEIEKKNKDNIEKIKTKIKDFRNSKNNNDNKIKIGKKFTKVFNGLSVDVSEEEINEIKKIPGVKAVYPNLMVNVSMMDAV